MKRFGEDFSFNGNAEIWDAVANLMDDGIRERVHFEGKFEEGNTDSFLGEYLKYDPAFVQILDSEFGIVE